MASRVKILIDEDGVKQLRPKWHLVVNYGDARRTACSGEVFEYGEGTAVGVMEPLKKGGVTCEECIDIIKFFKSIQL